LKLVGASLSSYLTLLADELQALRWARTEWHVNMISMSFGYHKTGAPDTVKQEIEKCFKDNIIVFASASNDGANMPRTYPGKYNRVLCIHSATGLGSCSSFNPTAESSETRKDNFSVLGDGIRSSWPIRREGDSKHRHMSGTSFATPVAVSIAAFAIGYIRMKLSDLEWNTDPMSPDGVRTIFYEMSKGNRKEGYDLVFPTRFFNSLRAPMVRETLIDALGGYTSSKKPTA
jgi:Subtilase family